MLAQYLDHIPASSFAVLDTPPEMMHRSHSSRGQYAYPWLGADLVPLTASFRNSQMTRCWQSPRNLFIPPAISLDTQTIPIIHPAGLYL